MMFVLLMPAPVAAVGSEIIYNARDGSAQPKSSQSERPVELSSVGSKRQ